MSAEYIEPLSSSSVKGLVKDVFIHQLQKAFSGNHPQYPDLTVAGQFADIKAEFKGIVVSWEEMKLTRANIGQDDVYWWQMFVGAPVGESIEEGNMFEDYRSDNYLFDGKLSINVAARDTMDRDGICDAISTILLWDREFMRATIEAGVEFENTHTWSGDNEGDMQEGSTDQIHTDVVVISVSGEVWCRRDPTSGLVESIQLVPYYITQPDPMPEGSWTPSGGLS